MEVALSALITGIFGLLITRNKRAMKWLREQVTVLTKSSEDCKVAEAKHEQERNEWQSEKRHYQDELTRRDRDRDELREELRSLQGKYIEQDQMLKNIQKEREEERRNAGGNQRRHGDRR